MKYYQINRIHKGSMIEEILRTTIQAETEKDVLPILLNTGFKPHEIIEIDHEFEKIKVCY